MPTTFASLALAYENVFEDEVLGVKPRSLLVCAFVRCGAWAAAAASDDLKVQLAHFHEQQVVRASLSFPSAGTPGKTQVKCVFKASSSLCMHCCKASEKSLPLCQGCKQAYFCSKKCQQSGWSKHKSTCKAVQAACCETATLDKSRHLAVMMDAMQPDKGRICTYYVAALVGIYASPDSSCVAVKRAGILLMALIYLYTGAIVPEASRQVLCNTIAENYVRPVMRRASTTTNRFADSEVYLIASHLWILMRHDRTFEVPSTPCLEYRISDAVMNGTGYWVGLGLMHLCGDGDDNRFCQHAVSGMKVDECMSALQAAPAHLESHAALYGSGLVASAWGLLHQRQAALRLVDKWSQGRWSENLTPVVDLLVLMVVQTAGNEVQATECNTETGRLKVMEQLMLHCGRGRSGRGAAFMHALLAPPSLTQWHISSLDSKDGASAGQHHAAGNAFLRSAEPQLACFAAELPQRGLTDAACHARDMYWLKLH